MPSLQSPVRRGLFIRLRAQVGRGKVSHSIRGPHLHRARELRQDRAAVLVREVTAGLETTGLETAAHPETADKTAERLETQAGPTQLLASQERWFLRQLLRRATARRRPCDWMTAPMSKSW